LLSDPLPRNALADRLEISVDRKTLPIKHFEATPGGRWEKEWTMAQKPSEMTDPEIKDLMRAIAKANGRPLSEERVEADLPAYKGFLLALERLDAYKFAQEDEPAFHFSLRAHAGPSKEERR
jgi:hypothetical protein